MTNNEMARKRADEIDSEIIETLKQGKSFRVEAGAGAGKTYSLMKVIDWLEKEKRKEFSKFGQHVACITYTNAAVDVIKSRLRDESFIHPCTIHTFAWNTMKRFQSSLIEAAEKLGIIPTKDNTTEKFAVNEIHKISYELGVRYVQDGELFLYHDDVIRLFVFLLDKEKFRFILAHEYPIILIDEYQDSFKSIISQFLSFFIEQDLKPQFGFFGDSWQTIYISNGACGEVESSHLTVINKEANFRSQKVIVDALNKIRPELTQITASDDSDGHIFVITSDDYKGNRLTGYYKDELPENELFSRIEKIRTKLKGFCWTGSQKTLMLTHRMLAKEQNYFQLFEVLGDHLRDADDEHFLFFMEKVEPVFDALAQNNSKMLFEALGVNRRPIESIEHKIRWKQLLKDLRTARHGSIYDVLDVVERSRLIGLSDVISYWLRTYRENGNELYYNKPIKAFYDISYVEIVNAIRFQFPDSEFSTSHGVKGEEYDNVLFVIGRGWNNYKFDAELYLNKNKLNGKDLDSYIRNRNLFYVCCSRPKKNLVLFISVPVNSAFMEYLSNVFGQDNIMTYSQFMGL